MKLLILFLIFHSVFPHICIHDRLQQKQINHVTTKRETTTKDFMRLKINDMIGIRGGTESSYESQNVGSYVDGYEGFTPEVKTFLKDIINDAQDFFQKSFKVDRLTGSYKDSFSDPNLDLDTLSLARTENKIFPGCDGNHDNCLIVTTIPYSDKNVLGFAANGHKINDRPYCGYLNIVPNAIDKGLINKDYYKRYVRGIVIHEMMHALGFTKSIFNQSQSLSITAYPKAVNAFKEHTSCSTLSSIPLENNGGSGTAGSHWEKSVFFNEIMTGSSSYEPAISKMTLATFDDMEFYEIDYSLVESYSVGFGKGCGLVSGSCDTNPYSCSGSGGGCTAERTAYGVCSTDQLSDCSIVLPYETGLCTGSRPGITKPSSIYGETYDNEKSRCFDGTFVSAVQACFLKYCLETTYMVRIGDEDWYECKSTNQEISNAKYAGKFKCPAYGELCNGKVESGDAFPIITSVTPDHGKAGDKIIFEGKNLDNAVLYVMEPCASTIKIDDTHSECIISDLHDIFNSLGAATFGSRVSVAAKNASNGYKYVKQSAFTLDVSASDLWSTFKNWSKRNLFLTLVIIFGSIMFVGLFVFGTIRCFCKKK